MARAAGETHPGHLVPFFKEPVVLSLQAMTLLNSRPSVLLGQLGIGQPNFSLLEVRGLVHEVVRSYWLAQGDGSPLRNVSSFGADLEPAQGSVIAALGRLGADLAQLSPLDASFIIGRLYTALLPKEYRSRHGIFFTPPSLARRLLDLVRATGQKIGPASVLDPACGGGAFLAPVASAKLAEYRNLGASRTLDLLEATLRGFEIDPFSAWLSQVFLETVARPVTEAAGRRLRVLVDVTDALESTFVGRYDIVIGNPPYGRVKLESRRRQLFERGLYGHANNYGLFTDLALRLIRDEGVVAFVTPTSFLSGQYFKKLRRLLVLESTPRHLEFISDREGVFDDVLQETMLATFRRASEGGKARVRRLSVQPEGDILVEDVGDLQLPLDAEQPWLLPREPLHARHADAGARFPTRLRDLGYLVSTGPLVWNRHKTQLRGKKESNCYPLIWAEAVTADGRFEFRANRKNHEPYFDVRSDKDEWLLVRDPCVLLQRTTAKEQHRRLIATELPGEFLDEHGAVVVENHLNMIYAPSFPLVGPSVIARLLNSRLIDELFRCLSGSVAVSAFELEALPLPPIDVLERYEHALKNGASDDELEVLLERAYSDDLAPTIVST